MVAKALARRAVLRAVVAASTVLNIASYHAAYVVCLGVALALTTAHGETRVAVLLVSVFDFLTFGALLLVFHAAPDLFRTGWFLESLFTELVIALIVRTRRPFFRSRPGRVLQWSTVAIGALTIAIPYLPFIGVFGFVPLPGTVLIAVTAITALYVVATEMTKRRFYRGVL